LQEYIYGEKGGRDKKGTITRGGEQKVGLRTSTSRGNTAASPITALDCGGTRGKNKDRVYLLDGSGGGLSQKKTLDEGVGQKKKVKHAY